LHSSFSHRAPAGDGAPAATLTALALQTPRFKFQFQVSILVVEAPAVVEAPGFSLAKSRTQKRGFSPGHDTTRAKAGMFGT
jgi:hypothetical protein